MIPRGPAVLTRGLQPRCRISARAQQLLRSLVEELTILGVQIRHLYWTVEQGSVARGKLFHVARIVDHCRDEVAERSVAWGVSLDLQVILRGGSGRVSSIMPTESPAESTEYLLDTLRSLRRGLDLDVVSATPIGADVEVLFIPLRSLLGRALEELGALEWSARAESA